MTRDDNEGRASQPELRTDILHSYLTEAESVAVVSIPLPSRAVNSPAARYEVCNLYRSL